MPLYITDAEHARFRSKFIVNPVTDCWVWQGPLDKDGYGTFYLRRRNRRAHRVGWFTAFGEIPNGTVINHTCETRACVNPYHLEITTVLGNALRNSKSAAMLNSAKTGCPKGHPYDRKYISKRTGRPQRYCSICEQAKGRRLKQKWRAEDTLKV